MITAKQWDPEALFALQGIALAPGRAERLVRTQQALLEQSAADPLVRVLEFQADPPSFLLTLHRCE